MKLCFLAGLSLFWSRLSATENAVQDPPAPDPKDSANQNSPWTSTAESFAQNAVYPNPKSGRIKSWKEAVARKVEPTCSGFLGTNTNFVCGPKSVLNSRKNDPQFFYLSSVQSKTDANETYFMGMIKPGSPAALRKTLASLRIQQTLDPEMVNQVLFAEAEDDYVTAVFKELILPDDGHLVVPLLQIRTFQKQKVRKFLEMVRWLHSQGLAGVDLDVGESRKERKPKLTYLLCLTNLGEPIGACVMKPDLVDPLARRQSDEVMADEAMDYYSFAVHVLRWASNSEMDLYEWGKTLRHMMDVGRVVFPQKVPLTLMMMLVALLQNDRAVRSSAKIRDIFIDNYLNETHPFHLDTELGWLTKDSVFQVPEFQDALRKMGLSRKQDSPDEVVVTMEEEDQSKDRLEGQSQAEDAAPTPAAEKTPGEVKAEEEQRILGMTRFALISIISLICVFVIALLIFLFFRKGSPAPEPQQPLEVVATQT